MTRIVDGDTFEASARIWLDQQIAVRVRIADGRVTLSEIRYDKYGGWVDARVVDARGDVAAAMIRARLARPYDGGRRDGWCGV
ncbi:MAG TPA: hypothetical protein VGB91_02635 [Rhizomicrobium sp.]